MFVLLFAALVAAAISGGGGRVAEKPEQEHKAAGHEQPQKKEQPQQGEQAQGGQQQQGGGGQEPEQQKPSFGDGTYQVGTDIQPGTYRTREGSPNCYWERLKNFTGGANGILANGNTNAPAIITIEPTDAGFNSQGCGTWTKDLSAIMESKTSFGAGAYIVGTDMEPGTYRSSGGNNCYYERLKNFTGGMNGIISNGNTNNPTIVTIAPTDAGFQSQSCGTWTKLAATESEVDTSQEQAPEDVLAAQYKYINSGDYENAYALFAEESQQIVSPEQYSAFFEINAPYIVSNYSFPAVQVQGETATVEVAFTASSAGGEGQFYKTQQLVQEDGAWRVIMRDDQVAAFLGTG